MFKLKKRQKLEVVTPISGEYIAITEVNDQVFAQKLMGDGFAVKPMDGDHVIVAPISGKIIALPESKHAIGIRSDLYEELEVLVHIGIDTVKLQGKGFSNKVALGQSVSTGTPIIEFEPEVMHNSDLDMTTMIIFTKGYTSEINLGNKLHQIIPSGVTILQEK